MEEPCRHLLAAVEPQTPENFNLANRVSYFDYSVSQRIDFQAATAAPAAWQSMPRKPGSVITLPGTLKGRIEQAKDRG